jgi:hypothetical protein
VREDFACFQAYFTNSRHLHLHTEAGHHLGNRISHTAVQSSTHGIVTNCPTSYSDQVDVAQCPEGELKEATYSHRLQCWVENHGMVVHLMFCLL